MRIIIFLTLLATHVLAQTGAKHIITFMQDDVGYGDISGLPGIDIEYSTPNLEALIPDALYFDSWYAQPQCTPGRGTFLTGRSIPYLGLGNQNAFLFGANGSIPVDTPILAEYLADAGYTNAFFGKWHTGDAAQAYRPWGRGYQTAYSLIGGYFDDAECCNWYGRNAYFINNIASPTANAGEYHDKMLMDATMAYLDTIDTSESHHISITTVGLHYPIVEANFGTPIDGLDTSECSSISVDGISDSKMECRRDYCTMMKFNDYFIGKLVEKLQDLGMWDETLMVLTADNGAMGKAFNEPGREWEKNALSSCGSTLHGERGQGYNPLLRGGKASTFEGGIRVPTLIFGGALDDDKQGVTVTTRFRHEDMVPTLLDAVGLLDQGVDLDGRSAWDNLDTNIDMLITAVEFGEFPTGTINMPPMSTISVPNPPPVNVAIRADGMKLIMGIISVNGWYDWYDDSEYYQHVEQYDDLSCTDYCLFNLVDDKYERNNLWPTLSDSEQNEWKAWFKGLLDTDKFLLRQYTNYDSMGMQYVSMANSYIAWAPDATAVTTDYLKYRYANCEDYSEVMVVEGSLSGQSAHYGYLGYQSCQSGLDTGALSGCGDADRTYSQYKVLDLCCATCAAHLASEGYDLPNSRKQWLSDEALDRLPVVNTGEGAAANVDDVSTTTATPVAEDSESGNTGLWTVIGILIGLFSGTCLTALVCSFFRMHEQDTSKMQIETMQMNMATSN